MITQYQLSTLEQLNPLLSMFTLTYRAKLQAFFVRPLGWMPLERNEAGPDESGAKIVCQYHSDYEEEEAEVKETPDRGHRPPHQMAVNCRYGNDGDGGEGEDGAPVT